MALFPVCEKLVKKIDKIINTTTKDIFVRLSNVLGMNTTDLEREWRIDDLPLLAGVIRSMKCDDIFDTCLPTHGNTMIHNALTNGEALCIWLLYLLCQGDHRKWHVAEWVDEFTPILHTLFGIPVTATDFSDDRLSTLAAHLADAATQQQIDQELYGQTVQVYDLVGTHIRLDATVFTGYHQAQTGALMQYGYQRGDPKGGTQCKLMAAATATGQYLTGQMHAGHRTDDPLYLPLLEVLYTWETTPGRLYCGDCKMSALAIRASIVQHQHYYYMPLTDVGMAPADRQALIDDAVAGRVDSLGALAPIWRDDALLGYGYEARRRCTVGEQTWEERVHVVRSLGLAASEHKRLDRHLAKTQAALWKLTPAPKQGVHQYTDEATLRGKVVQILKDAKLTDLVEVTITADPTYHAPPPSRRGRAGPSPPPAPGRYVISAVTVSPTAYQDRVHHLGWRLYVTNAPCACLSLPEGVCLYRQGAGEGIERMNKLLKDHETLGLDRLYVWTDKQLRGIAYLVTLAHRVLMHLETLIRRSLEETGELLPDYYPGGMAHRKPTAKTMLERVCKRKVTYREWVDPLTGQVVECSLTRLPVILQHMLRHLGLSTALYEQLLE